MSFYGKKFGNVVFAERVHEPDCIGGARHYLRVRVVTKTYDDGVS